MRGLAVIGLLALGAAALWLWGFGGADLVMRWASATQRDVQNAMAASLRALRAGDAGAVLTLWTLCFGYGFVHAAGPGHGKLVIGGYGVGARVTARRLSVLAVVSSLMQAVTAIVVVYAAIYLFGWGREQMTGVADNIMAPLSYALITGVGLWLLLRGLRSAVRLRQASVATQDHAHAHGTCETCGHAHAPTPEQVENVRTWRDAVAIVASIAIRPCTGAIFLLILTHALGIDWAGVLGALIMGIGTASFTGFVALTAVALRESVLAQALSGQGTARLLVGVEIAAGGIIAALALQLFLRAI
ncbi:MAG: hypothetical protein LC676_03525 [Loktanella sp.]|nr:hypothetical protein [Loktanella sp.]